MVPVAELLSTITSPKVFSEVFKNAGSQDDHIAPQSTGLVYTAAEDDLFPPGALQRSSTGPRYDDQGGSNCSSEQEIIPEDTDRLPPESDVSFRHSLNEKALREDPQLVRSVLAERNDREDETLWKDRGIQAPASTTLHLPLLDPATSFANSLTPLPSPQPSRKPGASSKLDASFPATHGGHAGDLAQKSSRSPERVTQQPYRQISPKPVINFHGSSIRDVTKVLGDDADMDFATRGKQLAMLLDRKAPGVKNSVVTLAFSSNEWTHADLVFSCSAVFSERFLSRAGCTERAYASAMGDRSDLVVLQRSDWTRELRTIRAKKRYHYHYRYGLSAPRAQASLRGPCQVVVDRCGDDTYQIS